MFRLLIALLLLLAVAACAPVAPTETATRAEIADSTLPPMKAFNRAQPQMQAVSNKDLVRDFIDLSFQLESGRTLPIFTRFREPIKVRVTGAAPASLNRDLAQLLLRLQREADIDIRQVGSGKPANITIQAVSRSDIRKALPQAACFVVPNVSSLSEFKSARRTSKTSWTQLKIREKLAIFVPADAAPQEIRDCLHEELAQAIGPLNDLYRLPNSVFNDDNVHAVLTGYDMLMLRAYYAPELQMGMTRADVEAALPAVFARLNPQGEALAPRYATKTPKGYVDAIQTALGPGASASARLNAANTALAIAVEAGWTDHRRAFAHYAKGRLMQTSDPRGAFANFQAADQFYAQTPGTDLHRTYVATHLAAHAIYRGAGQQALSTLDGKTTHAVAGENAALLSTVMLLQAEALEISGNADQARSVRLDSLGWARYGFGPDWAVRAKIHEIRALSPANG